MSLSQERVSFGIHSFTPYNRSTGLFDWGIFKVISGFNIALSSDFVKLFGGSNNYPWAVERGTVDATASGSIKAVSDNALSLFLGASVSASAAETTGGVSTIANKNGTSAVSATVGIASVAATGADEADLKFGKYVVKVASATTIDLYLSSDLDILRGTDAEYDSDILLIEAGIAITGTDGTTAVADFGITFTGGSGTVDMTVGDTATFEVRPINTGSSEIVVGQSGESVEEFGAIFYAEKLSTGEMFELDAPRCFSFGFPIVLNEKEFAISDVNISLIYDSTLNRVFTIRAIET